MESYRLEEILNKYFLALQAMQVNMRQLQWFLVNKNFDACAQLTECIKRDRSAIEQLERDRVRLLAYPLGGAGAGSADWGQLAEHFPAIDQKRIRALVARIKKVATHIQLLSQSIARFSSAVGETMRAAFEELVSAKEYTYNQNGVNNQQGQAALLYDGRR